MDLERDSDQFHGGPGASASTSTSSSILGQTSFYSLPPSPTPTTISIPCATFGLENDRYSTSATFSHDGHWDEFQTSGLVHLNESDDDETRQCCSVSLYRQKEQQIRHQNMLFGDVAICNDHTLSPSLKLPPRLQHEYHFDSSNSRSSVSSSQSHVSLQKVRISRHIFKSADFDPFLVAMKNVTAEGTRVVAESKLQDIRRASSFSSVWATSPNESMRLSKHVDPFISMGSIEVLEQAHDYVKEPIFRYPKEANKDEVGISASKRLGEPKGVKKARAVRLVKMGCCEQNEPIIASTNGPRRESGAFIRMKKAKDDNNQKSPNSPLWKVTFLGVFCFKKVQSGKDKRDKSACKLVRLTVVLYRPRLSFCLGVPRNAS